jgi:hypothetical protein
MYNTTFYYNLRITLHFLCNLQITLHFLYNIQMGHEARVLKWTRFERLAEVKHSSLLVPFVSYEV